MRYRGKSKSRRLRRREEGRHSTPERVLRGNLRLPCANLLKREQLKKNPTDPVAAEQPEVNAGELVDSEARLLVSAVMAREGAGTW